MNLVSLVGDLTRFVKAEQKGRERIKLLLDTLNQVAPDLHAVPNLFNKTGLHIPLHFPFLLSLVHFPIFSHLMRSFEIMLVEDLTTCTDVEIEQARACRNYIDKRARQMAFLFDSAFPVTVKEPINADNISNLVKFVRDLKLKLVRLLEEKNQTSQTPIDKPTKLRLDGSKFCRRQLKRMAKKQAHQYDLLFKLINV